MEWVIGFVLKVKLEIFELRNQVCRSLETAQVCDFVLRLFVIRVTHIPVDTKKALLALQLRDTSGGGLRAQRVTASLRFCVDGRDRLLRQVGQTIWMSLFVGGL